MFRVPNNTVISLNILEVFIEVCNKRWGFSALNKCNCMFRRCQVNGLRLYIFTLECNSNFLFVYFSNNIYVMSYQYNTLTLCIFSTLYSHSINRNTIFNGFGVICLVILDG